MLLVITSLIVQYLLRNKYSIVNKIIILTEFDLSNQSIASWARIIELAKVFNSSTNNAIIIASLAMDNSNPVVNAIDEEYSIFTVGRSKKCEENIFHKRYFLQKQKYHELKQIVKYFEHPHQKLIFIVYNYFSSFFDNVIFLKKNILVICERNERALGSALIRSYPSGFLKRIIFGLFHTLEIVNGFFIDNYLKNYDGFLTISENYRTFLSRKAPDKPILKIPVLYKKLVININTNYDQELLKVGYFGTINFKRDKIDIILKAISLFTKKFGFSNIELTIGGKASKHEEKKLKKKIKLFGIDNFVNYVGFLSEKDLFSELNKQNVLFALRNNDMQGNYSFATKIAMYMHFGKISIVSNVSDNSLYITNKKNAFILNKNDAEELAKLLIDISKMDHRSLSEMSASAFQTAQNYFTYSAYVSAVSHFLNEVQR